MNTHFAVAVHALTLLAYADGESLSSTQMAGSINTNPVFLQRILRSLREAGLIETQRGVSGGYMLRRSPDQISLYDVYRAVSADSGLFKVHDIPNPDCEVGGHIQSVLEGVFGQVEQATAAILGKITVADTTAMIRAAQ